MVRIKNNVQCLIVTTVSKQLPKERWREKYNMCALLMKLVNH